LFHTFIKIAIQNHEYLQQVSFKFTVGANKFEEILAAHGGPNALSEWKELNRVLEPVTELSAAVPPLG